MPHGDLHLYVEGALNLKNTAFVGKCSPYCILTVGTQDFKTEVATDGGSRPYWNQTFEYKIDRSTNHLMIKIMAKNSLRDDDVIGECNLAFVKVFREKPSVPVTAYPVTRGGKHHGDIRLGLEFRATKVKKFAQAPQPAFVPDEGESSSEEEDDAQGPPRGAPQPVARGDGGSRDAGKDDGQPAEGFSFSLSIQTENGVGDVPFYLSENHFLEGGYKQSLTAALDLCEKQVQVFENMLHSVVIFTHLCTYLVRSMSPTTQIQLDKVRHILDILSANHVDGLQEGVQIPSRLRNNVLSFCFESLVGLARRFEQIEDLLRKCSDPTIPWYKSALELANVEPLKPRRWSEFSLAIRNYEWSMDLVNLAFHALEKLLTLGTYTIKDASFRWCEDRCRMVLHIPGKYDRQSSSEEKNLLEVCRELEGKDLNALIQKLDKLVESEPDKKRFYKPSSSEAHGIARFLRDKLMGPTPELGKYYPDSIVFNTSDLEHLKYVEYLDKGSSGMVALYDWYGIKVAVKSVRGHGWDRLKFEQEVAILAMAQHPNVVRLIGCSFLKRSTYGPETAQLVMELMDLDLRTVIDQRMEVLEGSASSPFSPMVAIDMMQQIALAMQYLRLLNVLHRDLKAKNVLVKICKPLKTSTEVNKDSANTMLMAKPVSAMLPHTQENYVVKLADFAQGQFKCRSQLSWVGINGTNRWRAPEVFNVPETEVEQKYKWPADVYSFAMTSYEIVTGKWPLESERYNYKGLHAKIMAGMRPSFDNLRPEFHAVRDLIQECWATNPADRPDFDYIVQKLWECKVLAILPGFERKFMQTSSLTSGDGSNIFGDETCDITLRTDNLEGANDPHGNIEDDYEVFKDQLYEDIKRIDCIEEIAIDHIDIQTLLHSQGIVILSFFDENEEIFEFYFKNREDMASIVGVGLEYAMVILESGEVTIEEIIEEDWNQRWRSIETNSRENKKLFKIMTPTPSYVYEGPIHLDVELSSKKPLLWELTKYFSLRKSIATFVTKDIFVEYAQSVGTSSSTSFKNQAEGSILKGTWKFVTWFINGGSQENENQGSTSNQIEERVVDDGKNSATIVELKLLKEGLDLKDEKVVEPFLGTINSNLQFQFINDAGDRKDEKEIHITVGHVFFTRGRDKDGKQSPWYHDNFQVIFGLLDEEAQNHGEIKGRSFRPLDMKSGTESMKTASTHGHTKGKESIKKGVVSIAPHIVGLSGEYQRKSGLQNSEMTGSERGVEISNNTYTDGGLALLSSEDQFKIVCDYIVLEDLSHKRPSCHYHDQEVIFKGIWLPTEDGEFSSQFVEYLLQATRALLYEGKRNQHKYMKSILVNHFMTHLDGKTYKLRERKRNSEGESGSILTESRSWSPPQWSVEPLVEIKDPPIEVTNTTTEHVDQHQTNNMSPQISSWTNRLMNRGRRIVRRDRSTQSGNSFRETSVPESRQEVNGDSNPTRRGSMRW